MALHWQFKDGFAASYGGFKDFHWYADDYIRREGLAVSLPAVHPMQIALQARMVGGNFLIWMNEVQKNKDLKLGDTGVEWLANSLYQVFSEVMEKGLFRLDCIFYLKQHVYQVMDQIAQHRSVEIPVPFTMQLCRIAESFENINTALFYLSKKSQERDLNTVHHMFNVQKVFKENKVGKKLDEFEYIPYSALHTEEEADRTEYWRGLSEMNSIVRQHPVGFSLPISLNGEFSEYSRVQGFLTEARARGRADANELVALIFETESLQLNLIRVLFCHPTIEEFRVGTLEQQMVDASPVVLRGPSNKFEALVMSRQKKTGV